MNKSIQTPLLTLEEAQARLHENLIPVTEVESCPLVQAAGRVLAEPLISPITTPGFDNSAMDGYAFCHHDLTTTPPRLTVTARAIAGDPPIPLTAGTACRIFTGAPIPIGADTVAIQEDCLREGEDVILPPHSRLGDHIRRAGEDFRAGDILLKRGRRLDAACIGLAASCGQPTLSVYRPVQVTIFSTGNELRQPGTPLAAGQIYDSNRPMLHALLTRLGCIVKSIGPIKDDLVATRDALRMAAAHADVIVSTGGVSVGEEDHVKAALEAEGTLSLWRIAIKPGKPLAFGQIGSCHFLGLPGNPVSSFVTFLLFVQPFIAARQGEILSTPRAFPVRAGFSRPKPDRRREFLRSKLHIAADGALEARLYPQQSSGVLSSTVWADGLVDVPPDTTVQPGDPVQFLPFTGLIS